MFNYPITFRLAFLAVPAFGEIFHRRVWNKHYFNTLDFMRWLEQYRQSRAQLEFHGPSQFKKNQHLYDEYNSKISSKRPALDLYDDLIKMVIQEGDHEDDWWFFMILLNL